MWQEVGVELAEQYGLCARVCGCSALHEDTLQPVSNHVAKYCVTLCNSMDVRACNRHSHWQQLLAGSRPLLISCQQLLQ